MLQIIKIFYDHFLGGGTNEYEQNNREKTGG
jgi:hypothetical protein